MSNMKERPILFSGAMVRALLAGTKTQTRRIVKPQPAWLESRGLSAAGWSWRDGEKPPAMHSWQDPVEFGKTLAVHSPYGIPSDRLWVRETFCELVDEDPPHATRAYYDATHEGELYLSDGDGFLLWNKDGGQRSPWKPSIHMPRRLSRLSLTITDVRVQRLQDISRGDCAEEGWPVDDEARATAIAYRDAGMDDHSDDGAIEWYADLWESINGAGSWDANPWVWAITFQKVTP